MCQPDDACAWAKKCTFLHAGTGQNLCYLVCRGWESDENFAVGCHVCKQLNVKSVFGRVEVSNRQALQICNLRVHANHQCHTNAVAALANLAVPGSREDDRAEEPMPVAGAISGLTDKVPRLDRWVQALELVRTYSSFAQFEGQVAAGSVGSALAPGGDSSSQVARQLIAAMAEMLRQIDRRMLSRVVQSSISIDKTADIMLLYIRLLVPEGIYDFLGAVRGDTLSDVEAIGSALEAALKRMCSSATGEFDQDAPFK